MKTNSFEIGLSGDHHMIYTIHKRKFEKFEPKKLIYPTFRQFDSEQFHLDICNSMCNENPLQPFVSVSAKNAPKKTGFMKEPKYPF